MRAWMQRFLLALTLLWVPALAEAEPVAPVHPVLASGDMRTNLDLSGLWHYSIDPYRDGMAGFHGGDPGRSEEHTSELQSLMRIPYAVFCLKKKKIIERLQTIKKWRQKTEKKQ